ncbi:MAG: peroxiredoxin family protein [Pirellulaceae bacterium]
MRTFRPLPRLLPAPIITLAVAAVLGVVGSRSCGSDTLSDKEAVPGANLTANAEPQPPATEKQAEPAKRSPAAKQAPAAPQTPQTVPTQDAASPETPADSAQPPAAQEASERDPIRQLSRQYARRRAAKERVAKSPPPPANEIHQPVLVLSKEHRDTCLLFQGDVLPAGTLADPSGTEHVLANSLGKKLTAVVFWNGDNPYAMDQFLEMRADLVPLSDQGVQAIAIHVGAPPPDYAQMCQDHGEGLLCLLDAEKEYFAQFATRKLPRTYLLDAQGKILWLDLEYSRSTRYDLRNALHYYLQQ